MTREPQKRTMRIAGRLCGTSPPSRHRESTPMTSERKIEANRRNADQEHRAEDGGWEEEGQAQRGQARAHRHHRRRPAPRGRGGVPAAGRGLDGRAQPARATSGGTWPSARRRSPGSSTGPTPTSRPAWPGGSAARSGRSTRGETPRPRRCSRRCTRRRTRPGSPGRGRPGRGCRAHFDYLKTGRDKAPAAESPAALVRKLEATAGGCRRLLGEWDRLREKAIAAPGLARPGSRPGLGLGRDAVRVPAAGLVPG